MRYTYSLGEPTELLKKIDEAYKAMQDYINQQENPSKRKKKTAQKLYEIELEVIGW